MNLLAEKVSQVEADIALEKGSFNLFALLEREDLPGRWDLVVSAAWAKDDRVTLHYLAEALNRRLSPVEMTFLSRVVVLDAAEDPVRSINENYEVEHGRIQLDEPARFGLPVKHGYIITSRRAA